MKNMILNLQWRFFLCLVSVGILTACTRDYLIFDNEAKTGIYFYGYNTDSTFRTGNGLEEWYTASLRVQILGAPKPVDRKIKVTIVDSLTTVPSGEYEVSDTCYIPANEVYGALTFRFSRPQTENANRRILCLTLDENNEFRPVMTSRLRVILTVDKLRIPSWWYFGVNDLFGPWSEKMHILYFKFYHAVKETNSYIWYKVFVPNLGSNMEKARSISYNMKPLLKKYVLIPLYDYMEAHPEEGENTIPDPRN